jgi:hypothetical protein
MLSISLRPISLSRRPDVLPITNERDKDTEAETVSDLTP